MHVPDGEILLYSVKWRNKNVILRKYKAVCILRMRKTWKSWVVFVVMSMQGPSIKDHEHLRCAKKVCSDI